MRISTGLEAQTAESNQLPNRALASHAAMFGYFSFQDPWDPSDPSTSKQTLVCNSIRAKLRGSLHLEKSKPHRVAPPNENKKQMKQTSVWIDSLPSFFRDGNGNFAICVCVFPCCFSEESFRDGRKTKKNTSTGLEKFVPLIHALHPLGFFLLGTSVKPRGGKPLRPQTKLRAHGQCSDKCMPERIQLEAN